MLAGSSTGCRGRRTECRGPVAVLVRLKEVAIGIWGLDSLIRYRGRCVEQSLLLLLQLPKSAAGRARGRCQGGVACQAGLHYLGRRQGAPVASTDAVITCSQVVWLLLRECGRCSPAGKRSWLTQSRMGLGHGCLQLHPLPCIGLLIIHMIFLVMLSWLGHTVVPS